MPVNITLHIKINNCVLYMYIIIRLALYIMNEKQIYIDITI